MGWGTDPVATAPSGWGKDPLVGEEPVPGKKPSGWEAFARGAGQGLTAGFGDEGGGALAALMQGGVNLLPKSLQDKWDLQEARAGDAYDYVRAADRANNKAAEQAHGGAYLGGNLLGGLATAPLLPGGQSATLGSLTKTGAALGALGGLGNSEADLTKGEVGRALIDSATGGVLGAGAGALGYGGGRLLGAIAGRGAAKQAAVQQAVREAAEKEAAAATASARSAAGRAAQDAYKQLEHLRELKMTGQLTAEQAAAVEELTQELGEKAQDKLLPAMVAKSETAQALREVAASEAQRAEQAAAEKLSGGELGRQVKARALRYGLPALGGLASSVIGGHTSLLGLGTGALAGAGLRPMMHSMLRLGRQPVVQNALGGAMRHAGELGALLTAPAEAALINRAEQPALTSGFQRALADALRKKGAEQRLAIDESP